MMLKIKNADLDKLKSAIMPFDTPDRRAMYIRGEFSRSDRCKDKDFRYRWDLVWASGLRIGDGKGMPGDVNLYAYLNDVHIDSALRSFVPCLAENAFMH